MLYRLARGPAHTRPDVARLLGLHRHTIRRGLACDAVGGLEALRAPDIPAGTPGSRAPAVLARLEPARRRPAGFASYEALRQWGRRTHGVEGKDKAPSTLVRTRFKPTRKGARPRHTTNP